MENCTKSKSATTVREEVPKMKTPLKQKRAMRNRSKQGIPRTYLQQDFPKRQGSHIVLTTHLA